MTSINLTTIESFFLAALDDLRVQRGGPLRTLRGFEGPWLSARRSAALALPAVLIRAVGRRPPTPGAGQSGGWSRWTITVVVGGGRGEIARRGGSGAVPAGDPGAAWPLLDAVRARLLGLVPVAGCGPLIPRGEAPAEPDEGWSVWEQTWDFSLPGDGAIRPFMALSVNGPEAITPPVGAFDLEINLEQNAQLFSVGDPIFLAAFSGEENVYLGPIVSINGGRIQFGRAPSRDYPDNSLLWSPGTVHEWPTGRTPGAADMWDRGTEFIRVNDGDALAMRLATARRSTTFAIGPIPAAEADVFRAWLDTNTRGGVDPFTWVDEHGAVAAASIQSRTWTEEQIEDGLVRLKFDLALDEPGSRV